MAVTARLTGIIPRPITSSTTTLCHLHSSRYHWLLAVSRPQDSWQVLWTLLSAQLLMYIGAHRRGQAVNVWGHPTLLLSRQ